MKISNCCCCVNYHNEYYCKKHKMPMFIDCSDECEHYNEINAEHTTKEN